MNKKQNDNQELEGKLVESLKSKDLGDLASQCTELGLDGIMDEGILKEIPLIKTVISLAKIGFNIRDRIYIKKIYSFLTQVGETSQEEREKFIKENCQDVRRFEEAVLLILEQADNMNKSELIGKIFKASIVDKITFQDALSLSSIVNKTLWQDLENMLKEEFDVEMKMRLCNCGLLNLGLMKRNHIDETKTPTESKQTVDGLSFRENNYYRMLKNIAGEN